MDLTTYRSRSFKRLLIKVAQAKEELEEVKVVYQNAEHILASGINVFCKKNNIKNPLYELSKEKVKKEKIENKEFDDLYNDDDSTLKKTWKKTLSKVHPDKGGDSKELDDLVRAKKEKDFLTILNIAKKYDIEVPEESFFQIEVLEKQLKDIQDKINEIHKSFVWKYFLAEENKREKLIVDFFRTLGLTI